MIRDKPLALVKAAGFFRTFEESPVHDEWMQELYNYVIMGFHPGSFHRSCFENDLIGATHHTHPGNEWMYIVAMMRWMNQFAPYGCWGDDKSVTHWLSLSNEVRQEILLEHGYIIEDKDVAWKILETK